MLAAALLAAVYFGNRRNEARHLPDYTLFSTGAQGVSVFYDTLKQLRFPVGALYRPVDTRMDVNHAVLIIQPYDPRLDEDAIQEMMRWVMRGGRLIYLDDGYPNYMMYRLRPYHTATHQGLHRYDVGAGIVVIGTAYRLTNENIMADSSYGATVAEILREWRADYVYFAEYYHGYHERNNAFRQLPVAVRMAAYQLIIAALALVWHYGKRFGRPVPLYEEIERDENEKVFTIAKLYENADRRKK
jgi:SAM-dependent methyltransferase